MSLQKRVIGFDADDTLWHNETIFEKVHERYRALLAHYHDAATVDAKLFATEMRNLELYGYGVKGFTLSAIETAIELTSGKIRAEEIQQLVALGKEMLNHPVDVLEGVASTLETLAREHRLILITKGDLRDQERKLLRSNLAVHFAAVEIVSEKDIPTYRAVLRRHNVEAKDFVMVGNSLKSDIVPVLEIGATAVYVPYHLTWAAEKVQNTPSDHGRFLQIAKIAELPRALAHLNFQSLSRGGGSPPTTEAGPRTL